MRTALAKLSAQPLDLLIIGGGIVGSGVARDAAMRGLRVGLVDQSDFASGTSSRSSRLLHGGLRYLAQGRLGLVHEASVEKTIIHHIAPHLAQPLAFIFPTRRGTEWKLWKLRIGVKIYDLLCHGRNLGKSTSFSAAKTLEELPQLKPDNLTGSVRYFDGLTNDARLVLDTLRSAEAHGALLANYTRLESSTRADDGWLCKLTDQLSGESVDVSARCVINAAGAWADRLPQSQVKLRLTKGVHLVIDRDRLPIADAVVMTEGSRILFAIPWGQRVILGTTDTDYTGPIESPRCEPADARYILDVTNANFSVKLNTDDIISTWAGLRPLIADPKGRPSDISRAHQIMTPQPGWIDVAGGKLTTYRLMAEQTVDLAAKQLAKNIPKSPTAEEPLLSDDSKFSGILPPEFSREAVEHYCRNEWAVHLADIMIRRTSWRYYYRNHAELARQAAQWMREICGWSEAEESREVSDYLAACSSR